ncbi:MAG: hypothetical protein M1827_005541, partial [Pycnora praestabilis]
NVPDHENGKPFLRNISFTLTPPFLSPSPKAHPHQRTRTHTSTWRKKKSHYTFTPTPNINTMVIAVDNDIRQVLTYWRWGYTAARIRELLLDVGAINVTEEDVKVCYTMYENDPRYGYGQTVRVKDGGAVVKKP